MRPCVSVVAILALPVAAVLTLNAPGAAGDVQDQHVPDQHVPNQHVPNRQSLERACAWLWSQQSEDGGFRSGKYAVLKTGQAYTPFVLFTLLEVPESLVGRPVGGVERAVAFIRRHAVTRGDEASLGTEDPDLYEYPTYATAYAVRSLARAGRPEDAALVAKLVRWLERRQLADDNGFESSMLGYGGWGFGPDRPSPRKPPHMDLAHTRRVLEALFEVGHRRGVVTERAQQFLRVVQRWPGTEALQPRLEGAPEGGETACDGGFYFSPLVVAANKGRREDGHLRSYATATCDGALALLAAGVSRDDPRVSRARAWLEGHTILERPEGMPLDHPEPWHEACRFYHLAARAEAQDALGLGGDWRRGIARLLSKEQHDDGSFANDDSPIMREDDSILATSLAVTALARSSLKSASAAGSPSLN